TPICGLAEKDRLPSVTVSSPCVEGQAAHQVFQVCNAWGHALGQVVEDLRFRPRIERCQLRAAATWSLRVDCLDAQVLGMGNQPVGNFDHFDSGKGQSKPL